MIPTSAKAAILGRFRREPTIHLVLAQLSIAGGAFLLTVISARALGPSGRGQLALLLQVAYLASVFVMLGVDRSSLAVLESKNAATSGRIVLKLFLGPLALLVASAMVFWVIAEALDVPWAHFTFPVAVFIGLNSASRLTRSVAVIKKQTVKFLLTTASGQLLMLGFSIPLALLGVTQVLPWFALYSISVGFPLLAVLYCWRESARGPDDRSCRRQVRREGLLLVPSSLATSGMLRSDRLLLPILSSNASLGIYATASTITELLSWPLVAFSDSRLGKWRADALGQSAVVYRILLPSVAFVLVGGVMVEIVSMSVAPLLGPGFEAIPSITAPLCVAAGALGVARIVESLLIAVGRSGLASSAEALGFVASIISYLLLIPSREASGAATGSIIGYTTCLIVAVVFLCLSLHYRKDS